MIDLTLQAPELDALIAWAAAAPGRIEQELQRGMHEAVLIVEGEVVARTPVDTGRARQSIATEVTGTGATVRGRVFSQNALHMRYLEEGTGIYHEPDAHTEWTVTAKGKALKIPTANGPIFRRSARIRGMRARRMFGEGAAASRPRVRAVFRRALVRGLRRGQ